MLISTNYVSFAYYKLRQSVVTNYDSFFLLQIKFLQVATRIPNYDKTRNTFSQKSREANWVSSENKQ